MRVGSPLHCGVDGTVVRWLLRFMTAVSVCHLPLEMIRGDVTRGHMQPKACRNNEMSGNEQK